MGVRSKLKHSDWQIFAEKFLDLGNISLAGTVISQLVAEQQFNWLLALFGACALILTYSSAIIILRIKT